MPAAGIAGVVIADGGAEHGEPLPGVAVSLEHGAQTQNTSTDERGEFAFTDLVPGRYRLRVSKTGYAPQELGAFRPGEDGTPVELETDVSSTRVLARLTQWAAISGTVLTDQGSPAVTATVTARLTGLTHPEGPPGSRAVTDGRGEFHIAALSPGEYIITAADTNTARAIRTLTYFPGTPDPDRAERVTLGAGETRQLDPLKLVPATSFISGIVTTADGKPATRAAVTVQNSWDKVITATTDTDGRFQVTVPPAAYEVIASTISPPIDSSNLAEPPRQALWTRESADTRASSNSRLAMSLQPAGSFSGSVVIDRSAGPPPDVTVVLQSSGRTLRARQAAGRFTIDQIAPGAYALSVDTGQDSPWWLKSARAHGRSLIAGALVVPPGANITDAVLTMSAERGNLSGVLTGRDGFTQADYWVAAIPSDPSVRHSASPQVLRTRPATNGRFLFEQLPAGEYVLVVFGDLGWTDWRTPDTLASLVAGGIKLTVAPGAQVVQDIRIQR